MDKKKRNLLWGGLFALTFLGQPVMAQSKDATDPEFLRELASRIQINGYAQAGYTYTHTGGANTNTFDVKRTLMWAKARVTDRWSFLFMYDFSSVVQEFYTDYQITKNKAVNVRFGQFKNRLTMENPLSPTIVELVGCYSQGASYLSCGYDPLLGVQYGRDLGIDIYGQLFNNRLFYNVQVLNGQGVNVKDQDNKKNVVVALDYRPIKNLRFVVTGQKGYGTAVDSSKYCPNIKKGETYSRDRWSAGAEWKSGDNDYWKKRSVSLRGEYMWGKDGSNKSYGGYVTTTIPVVGNLDVVASYDYFNYNKALDMDQTRLVGGVQYWFYKKCRVQAQYVWDNSDTFGNSSSFQMQAQIAF